MKSIPNKRVLITGATGLVGYNLLKKISNSYDCEIHLNYLTNTNNDQSVYCKRNTFLHKFDISNNKKIDELPTFDLIFHCSGYGQPKMFMLDREKTSSINTKSLVSLTKKLNSDGKFIFISSSEVYEGSNDKSENTELTINIDSERACYTNSKRFGEILLQDVLPNNCKIVRLASTYGPGFKYGDKRMICEFVDQAIKNNKITLQDSGKSLRTMIYTDDCVNGILNVINGRNNIYNIGGKRLMTVLDIANKIGDILNVKVDIKYGIGINEKITKTYVDIARYENEFGTLNLTQIEDGLKKTIDWYIKNVKM